MAVRKRSKKTRAKAQRKTARKKTTRKKATRKTKTRKTKTSKTKTRKTKTRKTKTRKTKAKRKTGKRASSGLMKMSYTLSAPLAEVCGTNTATRPEVVKRVWAYIKKHGLQDASNRRMINPDNKLGAVLGNRQINMLKMAGAISKHLK